MTKFAKLFDMEDGGQVLVRLSTDHEADEDLAKVTQSTSVFGLFLDTSASMSWDKAGEFIDWYDQEKAETYYQNCKNFVKPYLDTAET